MRRQQESLLVLYRAEYLLQHSRLLFAPPYTSEQFVNALAVVLRAIDLKNQFRAMPQPKAFNQLPSYIALCRIQTFQCLFRLLIVALHLHKNPCGFSSRREGYLGHSPDGKTRIAKLSLDAVRNLLPQGLGPSFADMFCPSLITHTPF